MSHQRIRCIDQARAIAIFCMILVHFGEGTVRRLGLPPAVSDLVMAAGRIATPGFVAIFGLSIGLAYLHRFTPEHRWIVTRRLVSRGLLLLPCVLLVRIDIVVDLVLAGETRPEAWLRGTYSILSFYVVAVLSAPIFLRPCYGRSPVLPVGIGIGMWILGLGVSGIFWPSGGDGMAAVSRLFLVAGPYPYLQLMGTAVLMIPLGSAIKSASERGELSALMKHIAVAGALLAAAGLVWGVWRESELTLAGFADGRYKVPLRPWYFGLYVGLMLIILVGLRCLNLGFPNRRPLYVLALLGQAALVIYVGQALIIPGLEATDGTVEIEGLARVVLPLIVLLLLLGGVVVRRHQLQR